MSINNTLLTMTFIISNKNVFFTEGCFLRSKIRNEFTGIIMNVKTIPVITEEITLDYKQLVNLICVLR